MDLHGGAPRNIDDFGTSTMLPDGRQHLPGDRAVTAYECDPTFVPIHAASFCNTVFRLAARRSRAHA